MAWGKGLQNDKLSSPKMAGHTTHMGMINTKYITYCARSVATVKDVTFGGSGLPECFGSKSVIQNLPCFKLTIMNHGQHFHC